MACSACGITFRQVLQVHHKQPRGLGGKDDAENLCTLCANCHRLVHVFSVGRRLEGQPWKEVASQLEAATANAISALALLIRAHRERVAEAGNRWVGTAHTRGSIPLCEAVERVVDRNGYAGAERRDFSKAIHLLVRRTPPEALARCSIRLLGRDRYLSVNAGNYLLYRLPAFSDGGIAQDGDAFVIWPRGQYPSRWTEPEYEAAVAFTFRRFSAVNLSMSATDVLTLDRQDWHAFRAGCVAAISGPRTRDWPSNVHL
jgi:hypothetical protein